MGEQPHIRSQYTENAEAWSAFYQGWTFLESAPVTADYSEARLFRAEECFERVLDLDSLYAPALAGISLTYGYLYYSGSDLSPERLAKAEKLAIKAPEIDYRLPEARIALGQVRANDRDHIRPASHVPATGLYSPSGMHPTSRRTRVSFRSGPPLRPTAPNCGPV